MRYGVKAKFTRMVNDAPDNGGDELHGDQGQRDEQLGVGRDQGGPARN
jgi:hypothetical protein